jgi:hypothetical protein
LNLSHKSKVSCWVAATFCGTLASPVITHQQLNNQKLKRCKRKIEKQGKKEKEKEKKKV